MKKALSVYLHIPYCVRKCLYCDFLSYPISACQGKKVKEYLSRLKEEIMQEGAVYRDRTVSSVFFGGGTPSSLPEGEVGALMETLHDAFNIEKDAEITIECNPGTVNAGKLEEYHRSGINRLSFGLQSVHDEELRLLGRIHSYKEFEENYKAAREVGFWNINVDLMSGLPGQTVELWENTLRRVAELNPEHISAYSLIIEEGTPFYERYGGEASEIPDEDAEREMVHRTGEVLSEYGYHQYEISNYSKPGYECRHNLVYWRRGDYLGLGLGAASCVDEVRWKNTENLTEYIDLIGTKEANSVNDKERKDEAVKESEYSKADDRDEIGFDRYVTGGKKQLHRETEHLSVEEQRFEAIMLGLRLNEGIDLKEYEERYGEDLLREKKEWVTKMEEEGLLAVREGRIFLTKRGRDLMDYVVRNV